MSIHNQSPSARRAAETGSLFVIRRGYRAEWKRAGERPVTVKCRTEMFDPGPIIAVTGPGIDSVLEFSARVGQPIVPQLEDAACWCAARLNERTVK